MQGIKGYQEKLFINFQLSERVPQDNFYRRLKEALDFSYLRNMTKDYYGSEGQKSIDTVVFFKLMLIGYLENINSDRKIIEQAGMRMDMLYFLDYDVDEPLPWHSTLSRTRKLFGEEVFLELFRNILMRCVKEGMVNGSSQSIDSAFIKANASKDSLVEKQLQEESKKYYDTIRENEEDKDEKQKKEKRTSSQRHSDRFESMTDPDARISQKPGKVSALNHLGIISVDTGSHIICGATVDFADKKDSETTEKIVGQAIENLQEVNIKIKEVLADTNYSSGKSYSYLQSQNITAYIPVNGKYKTEREGFTYNKEEDYYVCTQGVKLFFKGINKEKGENNFSKRYRNVTVDCRSCSLKRECCKNRSYKELKHSIDKEYYDFANKMINTRKGKKMMRLRAATVEPVWGTLLHFRAMRKVYTIGNQLANKQLLMAATAYNLKKLMSFIGIKHQLSALKRVAIILKSNFINEFGMYFKFILLNFGYKQLT